jgi:hypothetical protein
MDTATEYKQPTMMTDETFRALLGMLKSPWYNWNVACGMKKPWAPWKLSRFKHYVEVTKMAIRDTLSDKHYPRLAIPNVRADKKNGLWSLDVQTWGHPDIQRIR